MKKFKKKIAIILLSLCLLTINFFAGMHKRKIIIVDNFNGEYILPNFNVEENYNS